MSATSSEPGRRALLTGGSGLLGTALTEELAARGWEVASLDREALDVTDRRRVDQALGDLSPEVVFHCAAFTQVDLAESHPPEAFRVNRDGTRNVALACGRSVALVYPSTDYVFQGDATHPYRTDAPTGPRTVYGQSKLAGEEAVRSKEGSWLIARTSWLYGKGGTNFVDSMIRLGKTRDRLVVVEDQTSRPTWAADLSDALTDLVERGVHGLFHVAGGGTATWYELAVESLRIAGVETPVDGITTEAFGAAAPRPRYSVLELADTQEILGRPMPDWRGSLRRYLTGGRS